MFKTGRIYGINGPVIYLKGNTGFSMSEMVYVGREKLVGEVIALDKDMTTIQVYEETTGLRPGEEVIATGSPVSVTLAPGILNNIFDGIERPLERIAESGGAFITRGVSVDSLDREKKWETHMTVSAGDYLHGGDIFAEVPETHAITHKCMVPPDLEGTVVQIVPDGDYTIEEPLITLELSSGEQKALPMAQRWPIRTARPTSHRFPASIPLVTGQRIIDTMFPIAKGGTAAIPGGFGTGKTMTQHQIAKWSDADIIIYIGCGERGNEMTQVLEEFSELIDPKTGNPLMDRTTLIAKELSGGEQKSLPMAQRWPIRTPRPVSHRFPASIPLVTGQRIIDTMFPIAKGGTAAIPGGFGTGKTMTQHQIAKWSDADIIIYIGCGERGNEMTQVLEEFSELIDPKTGNPLMDRTTLIANTSNMPVAAREASIYTGLTLAEYYRDMGYDVAIMADSTSRWAEALRELSGRLEEMPAEEGFPAYLASRLSGFYERAGMMHNLNGTDGSVTIIGAVSPQGGDFSEPVTQNTKRFVRCFWGLDKSLAYARHFPAIHWLTSYSEYLNDLAPWYQDNVSPKFVDYRNRLMALLNQESSLLEIVKLIGSDVLPDDQKLILEIARVIRLGFLQQNAFHKDDTCVSMEKQFKMMDTILYLYKQARALVTMGHPMSVLKSENIFDRVIAIKYDVPNDRLELFAQYHRDIDAFYQHVLEKNA